MFWFENISCWTRLSLSTFHSTVALEYRKRVFRKTVAHTRSHCYAVVVSTIITVYYVRTLFVSVILRFSRHVVLVLILYHPADTESGRGNRSISYSPEREILKIRRGFGREAQSTFCCNGSGYHVITRIKKHPCRYYRWSGKNGRCACRSGSRTSVWGLGVPLCVLCDLRLCCKWPRSVDRTKSHRWPARTPVTNRVDKRFNVYQQGFNALFRTPKGIEFVSIDFKQNLNRTRVE